MIQHIDISDVISKTQIISALNVRLLASAARAKTFTKDEYLLQIGEEPEHLIILVRGDVRLRRGGMDFKKLVPTQARPLVLGISGVVGKAANAADAQAWAAGSVQTIIVDGSVVREEVLKNREAIQAVIQRQAEFIGELDATIDDVRIRRSPLVRLIRYLACRLQHPESPTSAEKPQMRQMEIAAHVSSNQSDVSRAERALREADFLVRDGETLEVRRADAIRFLSFLQALASPSRPIHAGRKLDVALRHLCIDGWFASNQEEARRTCTPFLKHDDKTIEGIKVSRLLQRVDELASGLPGKPPQNNPPAASVRALLNRHEIQALANTLNTVRVR